MSTLLYPKTAFWKVACILPSPRGKRVLGSFEILHPGVGATLPSVTRAEGASTVAPIAPLNFELGAQVVVVHL